MVRFYSVRLNAVAIHFSGEAVGRITVPYYRMMTAYNRLAPPWQDLPALLAALAVDASAVA